MSLTTIEWELEGFHCGWCWKKLPLPIPTRNYDIIRKAINYFVAWPLHLIILEKYLVRIYYILFSLFISLIISYKFIKLLNIVNKIRFEQEKIKITYYQRQQKWTCGLVVWFLTLTTLNPSSNLFYIIFIYLMKKFEFSSLLKIKTKSWRNQ